MIYKGEAQAINHKKEFQTWKTSELFDKNVADSTLQFWVLDVGTKQEYRKT